ncbi:type II toxin-antitoxin system RelE/ParE family toxin [Methylobacterium sp. J-088]|uniref:type II toxin-antitoxin system RelE/ParE family toxin n=1 Tax=Methylobacterium sp. J-088 TaxID=2836664 RepID=UPI001FB8F9E2|nr:type II toxin-antitoxin system RelE/ParE family toxin [Methylobacterium sp. J-088]MCJ2065875.1 type II toxin-antitoxin system RelE/ParE family toxin [Methylobacterium sp. J-088]
MANPLHTIVETPDFLADAKRAGMTDAEREAAVQLYASQPDVGEEIVGSGGVRKGRLAGRGKGKSGGYRIVAVFVGATVPVYLIGVLSKGDRETFTDAEVKEFKKVTTALKAAFRAQRRAD